jgi:hypothetical protein
VNYAGRIGLVRSYYASLRTVEYRYVGEDPSFRPLMAAKLRQMIRDYAPRHDPSTHEERKLQELARAWIFVDSPESHECFGFVFICNYFGINAARARRLILERRLAPAGTDATIGDEPKGGSNEEALLADPDGGDAAPAGARAGSGRDADHAGGGPR